MVETEDVSAWLVGLASYVESRVVSHVLLPCRLLFIFRGDRRGGRAQFVAPRPQRHHCGRRNSGWDNKKSLLRHRRGCRPPPTPSPGRAHGHVMVSSNAAVVPRFNKKKVEAEEDGRDGEQASTPARSHPRRWFGCFGWLVSVVRPNNQFIVRPDHGGCASAPRGLCVRP